MTPGSPVILGSNGQPARVKPTTCVCGASPSKRVPSSGFGQRHPVCEVCGHEFTDEVWRGEHDSDRR